MFGLRSHKGNFAAFVAMLLTPVVALTFYRTIKRTMASSTPLERSSLAVPTAAAVTFNKNSQFNVLFVITAHSIALVALALDGGRVANRVAGAMYISTHVCFLGVWLAVRLR
jgi:uncharacterized membrane protein YwaF